MNLTPSPGAILGVVVLAAVAIVVIVEECWRAAHHDKEGHR